MKNANKIVLGLLMMAFVFACDKDDSPIAIAKPAPENRAPLPPELFAPDNNGTDVELIDIDLKWKQTIDPDGDDIRYDIYFDTVNQPEKLMASGLTDPTYALEEKLVADTRYYWKVTASDKNGANSESAVAVFTTRSPTDKELILGKWFFVYDRSPEEGVLYPSDCRSRENYHFFEDGTVLYTLPSESSSGCTERVYGGIVFDITGKTLIISVEGRQPSSFSFEFLSDDKMEWLVESPSRFLGFVKSD